MNSIKCNQCGLTNFVEVVNCRRCGNYLGSTVPFVASSKVSKSPSNSFSFFPYVVVVAVLVGAYFGVKGLLASYNEVERQDDARIEQQTLEEAASAQAYREDQERQKEMMNKIKEQNKENFKPVEIPKINLPPNYSGLPRSNESQPQGQAPNGTSSNGAKVEFKQLP